jgi:GntR family transcriptional regulator
VHFSIDPSAPPPPSEQLADQVRFAVAAGRLAVGQRLPSVRALAAQVRLNPNTICRAWRELEREGVVVARRGQGMFVASTGPDVCRASRGQVIAERLGRAVGEARAAGLAEDEVLELVRDALAGWRVLESDLEPDEVSPS